jgi:hypothetical protein
MKDHIFKIAEKMGFAAEPSELLWREGLLETKLTHHKSLYYHFDSQQDIIDCKYKNIMILGDNGLAKNLLIQNFCSFKAKELEKDKAAMALYDKDPSFENHKKTAYIDYHEIEKHPILLEIVIKDPSPYFIFFNYVSSNIFMEHFVKGGVPDADPSRANKDYLLNLKLPWACLAGDKRTTGIFFLDDFNRPNNKSAGLYLTAFLERGVGGYTWGQGVSQILSVNHISIKIDNKTQYDILQDECIITRLRICTLSFRP